MKNKENQTAPTIEEEKNIDNTDNQISSLIEIIENSENQNVNTNEISENSENQNTTTTEAKEISENNSVIKEKQPQKKGKKQKYSVNTEKQAQRVAITTSFTPEEAEYILYIVEERKKAGITRDNSHFLRQCIDFFINYNFVFPDKKIGMPENSKKFLLKDAYFSNKK